MSPARDQPDAVSATPPGEALELRPMTVRDLPSALRIEQATSSRPWTRATFRRELEDPATRRYVVACAPREGWLARPAVIGFGGVQARPDGAHITTVAVAPDHQRRGVGARLVEWLLDCAVELGCAQVTLEVRASNHRARRLYARAGFVDAGARRDYYRQPVEDAVIMWGSMWGSPTGRVGALRDRPGGEGAT